MMTGAITTRRSSSSGSSIAFAVFDVSDLAVAHVEDAVCDLGGLWVVGDHEDGLVELAAGFWSI